MNGSARKHRTFVPTFAANAQNPRPTIRLLRIFGEGYLQDALPYVHDADPLISLALEECEAVEPTFGHAVAGL
jgi:hypothetical protein